MKNGIIKKLSHYKFVWIFKKDRKNWCLYNKNDFYKHYILKFLPKKAQLLLALLNK